MTSQPKLANIQQNITFHQEELQQVSRALSQQSETVVAVKNMISTLHSKLQSKHQQTECLFRMDIGKFNDELRRKCLLHNSVLESLGKSLRKLQKQSTKTGEDVGRMESKLKELEEAVGM